jgi:hypothetical protein
VVEEGALAPVSKPPGGRADVVAVASRRSWHDLLNHQGKLRDLVHHPLG